MEGHGGEESLPGGREAGTLEGTRSDGTPNPDEGQPEQDGRALTPTGGSRRQGEGGELSRRSFVAGALAGGAAGLVAAAGTSTAVWRAMAERNGEEVRAAREPVEQLEALVELYERLDRAGLDEAIERGIAALALPLSAVELGAAGLRAGLERIEEALLAVQAALPSAREAFDWLEEKVGAVAQGVERLEKSIGRVLDRFGSTPVAQGLGWLLRELSERLPFGWGDRLRETADDVVAVVASADELTLGINSRVLEPLEERWFPEGPEQGLEADLVKPVVRQILDPLEEHLQRLSNLSGAWQEEVVAPVRRSLAERAQVRAEIRRIKEELGLS